MLEFLGVGIVVLIAYRFINHLGKSFPILELLLLIAGLQWIIGPLLSYRSEYQHYKYHMYVNQETYMSYIIPAFFLFALVILFKKKKISFTQIEFSNLSYYGKWILLFGVFADIAGIFAPSSLAFFLFLLSQFKFIGAGILIFSSARRDKYVFYAAMAYLLLQSLANAMFHELILWGIFYFMLWSVKYKPDMKRKLLILLAGVITMITIQTVKATFREQVWDGYQGNKLSLFLDILSREMNSTDYDIDSEGGELNVRLNQGWIISAIMNETPQNVSYADGATVTEALSASLLPRFLAPEKKIAGGQENFRKYTGLYLGNNTSMGMSIIGEAYANFGDVGGMVFMLFWGIFLVMYWNKILSYCKEHPLLIFFLPLLFLQVVKAETELVVVLNHLVKSSIVIALFFWFVRKSLKWNI